MSSGPPRKRRKPNRRKYIQSSTPTSQVSLSKAGRGIFFSCTPHHERSAFRDAVNLLSKHLPSKPIAKSLSAELSDLRSSEQTLTRVESGAQGIVFIQTKEEVDVEMMVGKLLQEAEREGNPGSKHCIRVWPVFATCYAGRKEVGDAAERVVRERFPKTEGKEVRYAVRFRKRLNEGVKRLEFIEEVAGRVEKVDKRYKVDLEKPEWVVIVEVVKSSCCVGVWKGFGKWGELNLREVAWKGRKDVGGKEGEVKEEVKEKKDGKDEEVKEEVKEKKDGKDEEVKEKKDGKEEKEKEKVET